MVACNYIYYYYTVYRDTRTLTHRLIHTNTNHTHASIYKDTHIETQKLTHLHTNTHTHAHKLRHTHRLIHKHTYIDTQTHTVSPWRVKWGC